MYGAAPEAMLKQATAMEEACKRYEIPLAAAALQFSLRDQRITSTIIGMSKAERLDETVKLAQYSIPAQLWEELEAIYHA
jgi:D-threo-aldose 1-dehydrogenase